MVDDLAVDDPGGRVHRESTGAGYYISLHEYRDDYHHFYVPIHWEKDTCPGGRVSPILWDGGLLWWLSRGARNPAREAVSEIFLGRADQDGVEYPCRENETYHSRY